MEMIRTAQMRSVEVGGDFGCTPPGRISESLEFKKRVVQRTWKVLRAVIQNSNRRGGGEGRSRGRGFLIVID